MPVPRKLTRTDVLVKVKVASVCGTDLPHYNWDQWAQNRISRAIPGMNSAGTWWPRART